MSQGMMEDISLSDLQARPLMAARQDSSRTLTPAQLEDGPRQPEDAHLPPCKSVSPSSFDSLESTKRNVRQGPIDEYIADKEALQELADEYPMPQPKHGDRYNMMRYYTFAVYQRLFVLDLCLNIMAILICACLKSQHKIAFTYANAVTAVSVNILMALLMRQENCINMLFYGVLSVPRSWSLSIRRHAAKIYCHGGLHSSSGISALLWYIFFAVLMFLEFSPVNNKFRDAVGWISIIILCFFIILCTMSHPLIRAKIHNQWELTHRFLGWISVALIWAQLCCVIAADSWLPGTNMGLSLVKTPAFWMLIIITFLLIYPWLRLRKVYFTAEKLSTHAIQLHFKTKKPLPACVGIGLSSAPLIENHKFATIPNIDNEAAASCIIANAGDWTKRLIDNPPAYLWTRGIPALGVARVAHLFRRVVLVATGSGIGPLMSFFNVYPDLAMRIVWSARLPRESYGEQNFNNVLRADPKAIIIDTKKKGMKDEDMPNLTQLAYGAYRNFDAEAVIVISNPSVTKEVVLDLEKRKVPAYGAIFDS